jgi:hypothetical protein
MIRTTEVALRLKNASPLGGVNWVIATILDDVEIGVDVGPILIDFRSSSFTAPITDDTVRGICANARRDIEWHPITIDEALDYLRSIAIAEVLHPVLSDGSISIQENLVSQADSEIREYVAFAPGALEVARRESYTVEAR